MGRGTKERIEIVFYSSSLYKLGACTRSWFSFAAHNSNINYYYNNIKLTDTSDCSDTSLQYFCYNDPTNGELTDYCQYKETIIFARKLPAIIGHGELFT